MAETNCSKKKFSDLKRVNSGASRAPVRAAIGKVGDQMEAIAKAKLATLRPLLKVNEIIIENFILFPLNTVKASVENAKILVTRPFANLGFGKDCPDTERVVKAGEKDDASASRVQKKSENMGDSANRSLAKQQEQIDENEERERIAGELKSVRDDV